MDINDIYHNWIFLYTKLNLNLKLGDGYLYGDATTNESMSYKINIQQGWPDTTLIVPGDLNQKQGQKSISFYTDPENQIVLRGNVKNEDTDMIRPLYKYGHLSTVNKDTASSYGYTRFRRGTSAGRRSCKDIAG